MIIGFILILIVIIPLCIYLYITNKKLQIKVDKLELERREILERKIINNKEDIIPIESISKDIISNPTNNTKKQDKNISKEYFKELTNKIATAKQQPIKLTSYEQEQENNAIISYQELKKKENTNTIDKIETKEFIEILKNLRNSLK